MKGKIDDLNGTYDSCQTKGQIRFREELDKELINSLFESARDGLERSKEIQGIFEKKSHNFSYLFTERYDILRKLLDILMLFDNVRSSNHQCVNAYICVKHPEFNLDWETLETMRILRNGVNYEGKKIGKETWDSQKIKLEVCISTLIKIIKDKQEV